MNGTEILDLARQRLSDAIPKSQSPIPLPLRGSPWIAMSALQKAMHPMRFAGVLGTHGIIRSEKADIPDYRRGGPEMTQAVWKRDGEFRGRLAPHFDQWYVLSVAPGHTPCTSF